MDQVGSKRVYIKPLHANIIKSNKDDNGGIYTISELLSMVHYLVMINIELTKISCEEDILQHKCNAGIMISSVPKLQDWLIAWDKVEKMVYDKRIASVDESK